MSYTPGPWTIVQRRKQEWEIDAESEPRLGYFGWDGLAKVYGSDDDPTMGNIVGQANAHLIAAAPDMYEALRKAEETITFLQDRLSASVNHPTLEIIRTVLAKARGQA